MLTVNDEADALREANELFYKALESLDLAAMERIWLHEGWVRCVHPGWDVLVGWPAVRQSWEQIFANTGWMRVTTTGVAAESFGQVGVVACSENLSASQGAEVGLAVAQATNLYLKTADGWRMFHHHASPAPVHVTQPFTGGVQ
jgi:ketosteroid isomerase-like protein